jgi:zinc D-Ala-D-Ala dipeptidase
MKNDETTRRSYWATKLDEGHAFMMRAMECPVAECGERLVSLADAVREAGVEVAFSHCPHVHDLPRIFVLREGQIAAFVDAARRLNRRNWVMRVEDGYRTRTMQKYAGLRPSLFDVILRKVIWELGGRTPDPVFLFRRLLTLAAQIPKTGTHMSGSAIDISVLHRTTGEEVDRGGPYLEISERTPMDSPFVTHHAKHNRQEITAVMRESGFVEYP